MATGTGARSLVVCGVDIGSTNVKVVAVDEAGVIRGRAHRPTPRQQEIGSIDAAQMFSRIEQMLVEVCGTALTIRAVSVAGVGEDGVLVDRNLQPLTPALPWFHPSRTELLAELRPTLEDEPTLPVATDAARTLVGWAWARRQQGSDRAQRWVALTDFAASRWVGRAFMSDTLAARTGAWLAGPQTWISKRVTATLGDVELLPPVEQTGRPIGQLSSPFLSGAGVLMADAIVVAGGHDHPIGGWGVQRVHPGAVLDSMGTAEVVVTQSPEPDLPRSHEFDVAPGICSAGTTMLAVNELDRNVTWASQDAAVGTEIQHLLSGKIEPDAYLTSEVFMPGDPGGELPTYVPGAPTEPLSRASAVLGALARAGASSVRALSEHLPCEAAVFAAGGWTRSPGWVRIKESVLGTALTVVAEPEVTAVGAALLAAEAVGWNDLAASALGFE